jgi:hypothetical protein
MQVRRAVAAAATLAVFVLMGLQGWRRNPPATLLDFAVFVVVLSLVAGATWLIVRRLLPDPPPTPAGHARMASRLADEIDLLALRLEQMARELADAGRFRAGEMRRMDANRLRQVTLGLRSVALHIDEEEGEGSTDETQSR